MERFIKRKQSDPQSGDEGQEITQAPETEDQPASESPTMHAGGIAQPAGYSHVGTIPTDDGSVRINVENLQENVEVDEMHGASLKLDRGAKDSSVGFLHGRIIHDFHAFLHIFRRDIPEESKTHFKTHLGHGSGADA